MGLFFRPPNPPIFPAIQYKNILEHTREHRVINKLFVCCGYYTNHAHYIPTAQSLVTRLSPPGDSNCFRLYNTLKTEALSFSTISSNTSKKENMFAACQALVSLARSCCTHEWAFRLAACIICLTMVQYLLSLQQYTTFGCQSQEETEMQRRKQTYFTAGWAVVNCPVVTFCCVTNFYKVLCLKHTKNE